MSTRHRLMLIAMLVALVVAGAMIIGHTGGTADLGRGSKLRVLIVEETLDRPTLPPEQLAIIESEGLRDYLVEHGAEGRESLLVVDQDNPPEDAEWLKLFRRPRDSVPWMVIAGRRDWWEGKLPATLDEVKKKCKECAK